MVEINPAKFLTSLFIGPSLYMHGTTNTNIAGPATTHLHLTVLFSVFNPGFSLTLRIYQQRIPCCLGDNNAILDR